MRAIKRLRIAIPLAVSVLVGTALQRSALADTASDTTKFDAAITTSSVSSVSSVNPTLSSTTSASTSTATAQAGSGKLVEDDAILRAFRDELQRTQSRLRLGDHPAPYFTSYAATDQERFDVYGSFGALDRCDSTHQRWINIDLRIGNRKLDSDSSGFGFNHEGVGSASLDNNYDAIRHDLWLKTDSAYKHAIENYESKKALLREKKIPDLPDSMAASTPVVSIKPTAQLVIDKDKWTHDIRDISGIFKSFETVINSEVTLLSRNQNRWFTNNEGCITREGDQGLVVGMTACAQASDGMDVADFEFFGTDEPAGLPDANYLKLMARGLAERVTALSKAPLIEDYRGPVMFEGQAAAEFFAQSMSPSLVNPNERISRLSALGFSSGGLKEKLGRRILPTSFTVVDDPQAKEFKGEKLKGGYAVDDEGVTGAKVTLVQNGILKTLCSGRTPSRYIKESNGHWRGSGASPSILFITSTESKPVSALKEQLMKMGKEDGLKYVLIARRITSLYLRYFNAGEPGFKSLRGGFGSGQVSLLPPTLMYKVDVDTGKEELVRGAKFEHLSSRMWRDIVAVGDDTRPHLVLTAGLPNNSTSSSLVCPSILVSEMDITKSQQEGDKPMMLKNPYFEKKAVNPLH